ncbi:hypothetical protein Syun_026057 [Stephania yunnanensis]|uniref:Uncharacterized protein n=1 Tax=Stephania yunnanensis TaxID=152371 RepID=A0AAP0HVD4_9MAGN
MGCPPVLLWCKHGHSSKKYIIPLVTVLVVFAILRLVYYLLKRRQQNSSQSHERSDDEQDSNNEISPVGRLHGANQMPHEFASPKITDHT